MNHDDWNTLYITQAVLVTALATVVVAVVELPIPRTHLNLCSPRPTDTPSNRPTRAALNRERLVTRLQQECRRSVSRAVGPFSSQEEGDGLRSRRGIEERRAAGDREESEER